MAQMQIEIWSDVICPWCWIGKARLAEALTRFEHASEVEVVHRAYMLGPNQPVEPTADVIKRNYGASPERLAQMYKSVADAAAEYGLEFRPEGTLSGDTRDAHRLIAFAGERGQEMLERLYRAYFSEGQSVHARESLVALAQELGFEGAEVRQMLESDAYMEALVQDLTEAQHFKVQGVPFFVMGRKVAVPGALPPEDMLGALRQAWDASGLTTIADGDVCTPESC